MNSQQQSHGIPQYGAPGQNAPQQAQYGAPQNTTGATGFGSDPNYGNNNPAYGNDPQQGQHLGGHHDSGLSHNNHNNTYGSNTHDPNHKESTLEKVKDHFTGNHTQNPKNGGGFGAGYTGSDNPSVSNPAFTGDHQRAPGHAHAAGTNHNDPYNNTHNSSSNPQYGAAGKPSMMEKVKDAVTGDKHDNHNNTYNNTDSNLVGSHNNHNQHHNNHTTTGGAFGGSNAQPGYGAAPAGQQGYGSSNVNNSTYGTAGKPSTMEKVKDAVTGDKHDNHNHNASTGGAFGSNAQPGYGAPAGQQGYGSSNVNDPTYGSNTHHSNTTTGSHNPLSSHDNRNTTTTGSHNPLSSHDNHNNQHAGTGAGLAGTGVGHNAHNTTGTHGTHGAHDSHTHGTHGTHNDTASKPSMGDKISGTLDTLIGKATKNDAKIAQGEVKKTLGSDALEHGLQTANAHEGTNAAGSRY